MRCDAPVTPIGKFLQHAARSVTLLGAHHEGCMNQLPDKIVTALRERKLLIVWSDLPLPLSEREPANRAAAIHCWIAAAKNWPPIAALLRDLPPVTILSLDPTARIEQHFAAARVPLHVVKTRNDAPTRAAHNLLKLGGDLVSRTGVVLSREGLRDLLSDADKRYLLDEARRIAQDGAVLIVGADAHTADFQAWWREIQSALGTASVFTSGDSPMDAPRLAVDFDTLINELRQATMTEEPTTPATSSRSGGVDIHSGQTHVGGDVTGRDKIVSAGGHIIHAGAGATVIIGSEHSNVPRRSQAAQRDGDEREVESLRRQLLELRENLRLIEERQTEFVLGTDVPLQLIKEERRLRDRIVELEQQL
jgi:hypothetical protein